MTIKYFLCYARPVHRSSESFWLIDLNSIRFLKVEEQRNESKNFVVHVCNYNVALRDSRVTTLSIIYSVHYTSPSRKIRMTKPIENQLLRGSIQ